MKRALLFVIGLLAASNGITTALAHPLSFGTLDAREAERGNLIVSLRVTDHANQILALQPRLSAPCRVLRAPIVAHREGLYLNETSFACPIDQLRTATLTIDGLQNSSLEIHAHLALSDGHELRAILSNRSSSLPFARLPSHVDIARDYLVLGVEHILTGFDHLLFVLGLLLLARKARPVLLAVSAFTAGHSITLALAVFDVVRLPSVLVEACIALSIVYLALELSRARASTDVPAKSNLHHALLAGAFGLIHGLGFAGALAEVGLPKTEIPLALASFNVGVELGQIAFICLVALLALVLLRRPSLARYQARIEELAVTAMGGIAVFFVLDRILG